VRDFKFDISNLIKERWSPRAFSREAVEYQDVLAILEAARYAPSCFNDQPWEFYVAFNEEELYIARQCINDRNRIWADNAPVLIIVAAKARFKETGKTNRWAAFDTGTAWGYLSLEAQRRGLITHAMGGFSQKKVRELIKLPEESHILAIIALGKMGSKADLDDMFREDEKPNKRKPLEQVCIRIKE